MHALIVTRPAMADIAALALVDKEAAAAAALLIQELRNDPVELEDLCVPGNRYTYKPAFECKRFAEAQRLGYNIYILKFRNLNDTQPGYRILIGYHAQKSNYYVLQVPDRNFAYNTSSPSFRELCNRYEDCGIPNYR